MQDHTSKGLVEDLCFVGVLEVLDGAGDRFDSGELPFERRFADTFGEGGRSRQSDAREGGEGPIAPEHPPGLTPRAVEDDELFGRRGGVGDFVDSGKEKVSPRAGEGGRIERGIAHAVLEQLLVGEGEGRDTSGVGGFVALFAVPYDEKAGVGVEFWEESTHAPGALEEACGAESVEVFGGGRAHGWAFSFAGCLGGGMEIPQV